MNTGFFGALNVFNAVTSFVGSTDNFASPFATLANPFPTGLQIPQGRDVGLLGDTLTIFDHRRVNPHNQQWLPSVKERPSHRTAFGCVFLNSPH